MIVLVVNLIANTAASFELYLHLELTIIAVYFLYNIVCLALWSQTLGKWLCAIQVIRCSNQPVNWFISTIRALIQALSMLFLGLPFIGAAVHRNRRSWHDRLSGTQVQFLEKSTPRKRWTVAVVGVVIACFVSYYGYKWISLFGMHQAFCRDANQAKHHTLYDLKNLKEVNSLDEFQLSTVSTWLDENYQEPVQYLVRFAARHDVTIVGEVHGKKQLLEFLSRSIPELYHTAGVRVIALECCRSDQDALLRHLVTVDKFDEALLLDIARSSPWHAWGYEEHWRVLESVWQLNQSLPPTSEPMDVIGICPNIDLISMHMIKEGHIYRLFRILDDLPYLLMHDAFYARCVEQQAFDQQKRTLVWVGASHAIQCQSSQRFRNGQAKRRFRMGAMLYGRYGRQVGSVLLHNEHSFKNIANLLEKSPVVQQKKQIGFTIADSPVDVLYDNSSFVVKYGKVELPLEAFFSGYIVVAPLQETYPCLWWKTYITPRMFGLYKPFYEKLCERKLENHKEANIHMNEGSHRF